MAIADGIALEQTVLGHALNDPSCYSLFSSEVNYTQFSAPNHKVIAYCLKAMYDIGVKSPDEDSFQLVVAGYPGEDKDYGGVEYIRSLKKAFNERTDNYEVFVDKLKLQAIKFKISGLYASEILRVTNDPKTEASDIRDLLNQITSDVESADSSGYRFLSMQDLAGKYLQEIDDRASRKFATTGLPDLDAKLTEGFCQKRITVLAGFTGMAKSTIAIAMAHRIAVAGTPVAFFSMESTDVSVLDKIVSTLTQIPITRLKREAGQLTQDEYSRVTNAVEQISSLPIVISDQASLSIENIVFQLNSAIRRGIRPKVVFIDLFGKVEDVDTGGDNLAAKIQRECKRIRVLCKTLDMHFVLVVQIGRQGFGISTKGKIKRPVITDIKNSNAYAEEADIVLLAHRNAYYVHDLEDDILEIEVAKQRDGDAGVAVYFELMADTGTIMSTQKRPFDRAS